MGNRFTRSVATLAGLVLAGTGVAAVNATEAAASSYDCPAGYWCGWANQNATGSMYKTNKSVADLGSWDNKIHSYVNRTKSIACVYDEKNYTPWGGYFPAEPDDAGEYGASPTATISSVKFVPTERECSQDPYPGWAAEVAPRSLGFGDMNGDGRADVLARDKVGRLWLASGAGTGKLIGSGGWNAMNALTRHGDFSRDGREDLIAREASTGKLWLYPGTSTGALGARKLIGTGGWNAMREISAVGDLTGDGRADLIAAEKSTGKLWLYPGTSTGALGARKLIGTGGWNGMNALTGVGDMNGDGRPDLYAREASTGKLWLYPGRASALGARVLVGNGGWNSMAQLIAVGDFSGDGRPDLAAVTNEKYVIDGYAGNLGWLVTYQGRGNGLLAGGQRTNGEWWGLNGFC
ncbi:FG-GAP-like repeat-containing protein [Streptomyces sp. NPDC018610]|uniref:FG-GAP-like repeat-containing protein n=1 Tax=Streptomyces sp. NPDC018610 TaxID=3365049 RepID=UPI0037903CC6